MSATQYLTDVLTRHSVFLERYSKGRSKEALILLNRIKQDINARLAQEPTVFQRNRLEAVLKDIEEITTIGFNDIKIKVELDMKDLAPIEAQYSANVFNKVSTVDFTLPADDQLISAVMTQAMAVQRGVAVTIDDALAKFSKQKSLQIAAIIADGVTLGDTTPTISKKVGEVIDTLQRRQLDTLVRTITNHASSISRQQVYNANADLMEGYQWIATLDSSTTLICGTRDKKVFQAPYGPMPPAHWGACVEDVLITTKRGAIPIQDVKVGDYALTHTGYWKMVSAVMAKPEKTKIVKLIDSFGSSVSLTNDHPVLSSVGYKSAGDIKAGDKLFNYGHKFIWPKYWNPSAFVKKAVLIDAHNMKTSIVERLVAYSITSKTRGMSSAINLNNNVINKKVNDITSYYLLKHKSYIVRFKKFFKHLLMKSWIVGVGNSQ